jgi:hypothetical protein
VLDSNPRRTFPILLTVIGLATVVGVAVAVEVLRRTYLVPVVIGVMAVVGVVCVVVIYRRAPVLEPELPIPPEEVPFDDPVEEADRLASPGTAAESTPEAPDSQLSPTTEPAPSSGEDPE